MNAVILKKCIISVLFATLIPFTTWWGFEMLYKRPDYSEAYNAFKKSHASEIAKIESRDDSYASLAKNVKKKGNKSWVDVNALWEKSDEYKKMNKDQSHYKHMSLYIFFLVALCVFFLGSYMQLPIIGSGFLCAGLLCILSSGVLIMPNDMKLFAALSYSCFLLILVFFCYRNLKLK